MFLNNNKIFFLLCLLIILGLYIFIYKYNQENFTFGNNIKTVNQVVNNIEYLRPSNIGYGKCLLNNENQILLNYEKGCKDVCSKFRDCYAFSESNNSNNSNTNNESCNLIIDPSFSRYISSNNNNRGNLRSDGNKNFNCFTSSGLKLSNNLLPRFPPLSLIKTSKGRCLYKAPGCSFLKNNSKESPVNGWYVDRTTNKCAEELMKKFCNNNAEEEEITSVFIPPNFDNSLFNNINILNELEDGGIYYIITTISQNNKINNNRYLTTFLGDAIRNNYSTWVYAHDDKKYAMKWKLKKNSNGTWRILTTKTENYPYDNRGLCAWHWNNGGDSNRNDVSSWVAVHEGDYWPMNWSIVNQKNNNYKVFTNKMNQVNNNIPSNWGLTTWNGWGAIRDNYSSRVAVHQGNFWPINWKFIKTE